MNKKNITITIIIAVVIGTAGFFGGMKYGQAKAQPAGRDKFAGQHKTRGGAGSARGDFTTGQILSKDNKSVTVQTANGNSRIVFYSGTTHVGKFISSSASDMATGQRITVTGTPNSDGSITAQNIEIMPQLQSSTSLPSQTSTIK